MIQPRISSVTKLLDKRGIMFAVSALILASCSTENMIANDKTAETANAERIDNIPATSRVAATAEARADKKPEYQFSDFDNLPEGFANLYKPMATDSANQYIAYMKDVDKAFFLLEQNRLAEAQELFTDINKQPLFEMPNDATWAGHAETYCRMDKKVQGRKKLANAQCTIALISRTKTCSDFDGEQAQADFPSECYREMCEALIIREDYDGSASLPPISSKYAQDIAGYESYVTKVEKQCR